MLGFSGIRGRNRLPRKPVISLAFQRRTIAGIVSRLASRFLRLRYIVLGAGVGGTYTVAQKYDEIKTSLPDLSFISDHFPSREYFESAVLNVKHSTEHLSELRKNYFEQWKSKLYALVQSEKPATDDHSSLVSASELPDVDGEQKVGKRKKDGIKLVTVEELQEALFKRELEFNKRVEQLLQENRELRSELLLRAHRPSQRGRIKRSLIDMYSEVLDELSDLDSGYNAQDQLPRVVVVGDQSAGKTSVLEMIAQARIFPRGSGEMMTRSPVKVTLSEGPYHVASFKDSPREYDLTKESELAALRRDIEMRMKALVSGGKTISSEVISLNVKGPGLQRIVLVDLPGIISTVTTGMQADTRETIQKMARHYMGNPNAIILCVQDGSIDAERSNVTDLVSSVDPTGRRTIFVLTKVDLAEANLYNPNRIKQILEGKLFPMKALGYFAVVTGKGSKDESIESIKEYEEDFFRSSRLFREGTLQLSQMTTANLSKAVSECFWKMVKDSVEQQADTYRALRYNLEAEWKNSFPHLREMDREELFEKARTEILDDLVTLNGISAATWESSLRMELWNDLAEHVFTEIFEPAQQLDDLGAFQTNIDIWLRDWVEKDLPNTAVKVGWETLYNQLENKLSSVQHSPGHDKIFDQLKQKVLQETRNRHTWDHKAENRLRVIQSNALDDRTVHDKAHWTSAVEFLERALKTRLKSVSQSISDLCGPDRLTRWIKWQNLSPEQRQRREVVHEISTLLASYTRPSSKITPDDLTTIRRNLQTRNIEVTDQMISETWEPLVQRVYLERALENCHDCRKSFYYYQQGFLNSSSVHSDSEAAHLSTQAESDLQASLMGAGDPISHLMTEYSDCREVVFFYRLMRMIEATGNALRQQIMNDEARRLEHHVKQVLSELSDDPIALRKLITGRRVTLAEELKRVRHLQEKLEEFISALNKDD
ncbi:Dynamin-like 120 kDa protein, mitochondrial [Clonorchis sinensis]|uniref:Dynamin-like GTPase OPA1, mitochondrial n=1 Tax=Clonorchis sinensis TaxID=79923 RepID=A0A8T1MFM1_CLOSI|nr:Dynamin-like 120 kDa protein, mitochondrial [Clonorchis sinensis]